MRRRSRNILIAVVAVAAAGVCAGTYRQSITQRHAVAKAITGGDPARAPDLIRRYGCGGCHTVPGIAGADGKVAPPLANLRERVFIGGVARNSADNLVRWIVAPQSLSPHTAMPPSGIDERGARDIAAYLYTK
jgi:cytochrome c2